MVDEVTAAVGTAQQQTVRQDRLKFLHEMVEKLYIGMVDKIAASRIRIAQKKQLQTDRNRQEREAAAHLSTSEVVEGYIGNLLDKRLGRPPKSNVDYGSMVDIQVKPDVVMVGDGAETDEQTEKRKKSKQALAELKRLKAEAKNYKSPGPLAGQNQPAGSLARAKPKAKAKPKTKGAEPKGLGKGKKGKGKGAPTDHDAESKGSGKSKGKGKNKGKTKKGKGKGQ